MYSVRMLVLACVFASPVSVQAATLNASLTARDAAAWALVDSSQSTVLPATANWTTAPYTLPSTVFPIDPAIVADPCQNACSPFYGGVYGAYDPNVASNPGWETTPFFAVFAPTDVAGPFVNQAVLSFARAQSALSLLWGSADWTNQIEFWLDGKRIANFWGAEFESLDPDVIGVGPGRGAALLSLSGVKFDELRFFAYTGGGSFEFSNVTTIAAVPLPPALLILLSALGMLTFASRRRSLS